MEENCMVLSGDWVCSDVGTWDFVIEKNRMGRMVEIYDGIGCKELAGNVLREFKLDEERYGVTLSYWPPTSFELATGIRTPPVMITNHGAVKYFCDHQKVKGGMNLFAKFELKTDSVDTEVVDDSGMAFVSPEAARFVEKRDFGSASSKKGYVSSAASKNRVIHRGSDTRFDFVSEKAASLGGMGDLGSGSSKKRNVTSPYKKSRVIDISDEDELVREVEKLEETIMSEGGKGGTSLGEDESGVINPHGAARDVDIPEEVSSQVVYPPNTKRQPGRRRKTRIPSTGEIRAPKKKVTKNKCGRCREEGHNRTNCCVPI
ncbi:hypothetical protein IGI04_038319 [Brassica rapa subsp. trilocularis]|uniref:Uncharacterized protein n=2 Tax=Brassica TaxID=3705 RepID=A0ABQ8CXM8_BRANA|nr:hypothetical protein IGI04_038319 [Brassica rapa subsp. trilocularis]KAH0921070.1 hypothetical protein HID58_021088 [Brassica napus]